MAWWGVSLAAGPHYNPPPMNEERNAAAWDAMQKALERIKHTSPMEKALIEALKHRNPKSHPDDRAPHNKAYTAAMRKIWEAPPGCSRRRHALCRGDDGPKTVEALLT